MATTVLRPVRRRNYDRIFFPALTALILAAVLFGFARTYYLAGMVKAPLPNALIHIHGAVFSGWLILLIVQTGLVSAGRVDIHKRLGLWAFGWSVLMVILGLLAATDSLRRGFAPGLDAATFYVVPVADMAIFATLIYFSYRMRRQPVAHKRLVIIATIALLDAAIARWPIAFLHSRPLYADLCCYAFLLLIVAYDLLMLRKVHRVTIWGSALIIVIQQIRVPIGMTGAWHAFARLALAAYLKL